MTAVSKYVTKLVSALSLLAVLLLMPVVSSAHAADPTQAQLDAMVNEIGVLVNEARSARGLKPLYMVPSLNSTSKTRANELITTFSHNRPNGSECFSVLSIDYKYASENIAAGSSTAAAAFDQWRNSEKHWNAILNPDITHMGVGVAYSAGSQYKYYWEQMFIQTWNPSQQLSGQYIPSRNSQSSGSGSLGDVNSDGKIDSSDATMVLTHYNQLSTRQSGILNDTQKKNAELTGDGRIDSSDATVILRYYSYVSTGGKNSMSQFIGR